MTKVCTRCGLNKLLSEYGVQSANKDGLRYYCKLCTRELHKERYDDPTFKNKQRDSSLKFAFGISLEQYHLMLDEQGGVCAICFRTEKRKHPKTTDPMALAVDHDHKTGQVRGLLCSTCNIMLGHAEDNIKILAEGIVYLSRWEG